ncbi:hypothetical protein BGZ82_007040 [Podila clonocystis]|nr:hypothetical protein BGZ82_007040 [Podila clonocystis]
MGMDANIDKYSWLTSISTNSLYYFYNSRIGFKKHKWIAKQAKEREYWQIADSLLKMVDGCMGAKRSENNKVVIGFGLGKFSTNTKLSSLHSTFQSYFIQKARSLGYIVVGVNEYYSSKTRLTSHGLVDQMESIRRLFCSNCKRFMHRDVVAGQNICNAVVGHLEHQRRSLYLQPVTANGSYPWMQQDGKEEPAYRGFQSFELMPCSSKLLAMIRTLEAYHRPQESKDEQVELGEELCAWLYGNNREIKNPETVLASSPFISPVSSPAPSVDGFPLDEESSHKLSHEQLPNHFQDTYGFDDIAALLYSDEE